MQCKNLREENKANVDKVQDYVEKLTKLAELVDKKNNQIEVMTKEHENKVKDLITEKDAALKRKGDELIKALKDTIERLTRKHGNEKDDKQNAEKEPESKRAKYDKIPCHHHTSSCAIRTGKTVG